MHSWQIEGLKHNWHCCILLWFLTAPNGQMSPASQADQATKDSNIFQWQIFHASLPSNRFVLSADMAAACDWQENISDREWQNKAAGDRLKICSSVLGQCIRLFFNQLWAGMVDGHLGSLLAVFVNHWKTIDTNGEPQNHSFNGNGSIAGKPLKNHW